jgi:predicted  nucleic acid-binding Zn-ribbon protein
VRENELQTQLELEREKNVVSLAKQNNLLRQLDAAEARVTELSAGTGRSSEREGDLQMLLTAEKERVVVLNARLNTLKAKSDKEVAALQERVAQLEEEIGEQRMEGNARPSRYVLHVQLLLAILRLDTCAAFSLHALH